MVADRLDSDNSSVAWDILVLGLLEGSEEIANTLPSSFAEKITYKFGAETGILGYIAPYLRFTLYIFFAFKLCLDLYSSN